MHSVHKFTCTMFLLLTGLTASVGHQMALAFNSSLNYLTSAPGTTGVKIEPHEANYVDPIECMYYYCFLSPSLFSPIPFHPSLHTSFPPPPPLSLSLSLSSPQSDWVTMMYSVRLYRSPSPPCCLLSLFLFSNTAQMMMSMVCTGANN